MFVFEVAIWISRRVNWLNGYSATLKLSWSFRRKHILDLSSLLKLGKYRPLSFFNASYLLKHSAWTLVSLAMAGVRKGRGRELGRETPKIKWTPREFIRPFTVIRYDFICETYFVEMAAIGWKGSSPPPPKKTVGHLACTLLILFSSLIVAGGQNIITFLC